MYPNGASEDYKIVINIFAYFKIISYFCNCIRKHIINNLILVIMNKPQIITNLPTGDQAAIEFTNDCFLPIINKVQDFITKQDSPLGDLNATLQSLQWLAYDSHCSCILTFSIDCYDQYKDIAINEDHITNQEQLSKAIFDSIHDAADEACTARFALPYILNAMLDNVPEHSHYIVTNSALIFTSEYYF